MNSIALSCFTDFVLKSGAPKLTVVRESISADPLITDFYRPLREAIVDMHAKGRSDKVLDACLSAQTDERRRRIFPKIIEGYRTFLKTKQLAWFTPPVGTYTSAGLEIRINPDLGFTIDGTPHVIKMYFRDEPLSKKRANIMLTLLTLGTAAPGAVFAVLDVRRAHLHTLRAPNPRLALLLRGEAISFATIRSAL